MWKYHAKGLFPLCHSRPAEGATAASAEGGSAAPEGASASAAEAPASAIESPKPVERAVEARSTDDAMASMVRVLCFYDTFLLNGTFTCGDNYVCSLCATLRYDVDLRGIVMQESDHKTIFVNLDG